MNCKVVWWNIVNGGDCGTHFFKASKMPLIATFIFMHSTIHVSMIPWKFHSITNIRRLLKVCQNLTLITLIVVPHRSYLKWSIIYIFLICTLYSCCKMWIVHKAITVKYKNFIHAIIILIVTSLVYFWCYNIHAVIVMHLYAEAFYVT